MNIALMNKGTSKYLYPSQQVARVNYFDHLVSLSVLEFLGFLWRNPSY